MTAEPRPNGWHTAVNAWSRPGPDQEAAQAIHAQAYLARTQPVTAEQVQQLLQIGYRAGLAAASLEAEIHPAYGADTGQLLRRAEPEHHCQPPEHGRRGDIWECGECKRRWQCVNHLTHRPGYTRMRADWVRRYWPWPHTRAAVDE